MIKRRISTCGIWSPLQIVLLADPEKWYKHCFNWRIKAWITSISTQGSGRERISLAKSWDLEQQISCFGQNSTIF